VAARSRARVCWRSLGRNAGSNPAGRMDICLLSVLCVVSSTESYRVWCVQLSVTQKPQTCGGLGPQGLSSHNISSKGTYPYIRRSHTLQGSNPPAAFMKVHSLPIQNYLHLQNQVYACMYKKFFSACTSKTGNAHIKATQRRVRLTIVAVEKQ